MAEKLPVVTARELIAVVESLGFRLRSLDATSHRRYIHPDGRKTTIPVHKGRDIGRGLLRRILQQIEISPEEFKQLLRSCRFHLIMG